MAVLLAAIAVVAPRADAGGTTAISIGASPNGSGYWVLHSDGAVTASGGAPWLGDSTGYASALAVHPSGNGYWVANTNGAVRAFGSAPALGGIDHLRLSAPIIAMAPTPTGNGYWLVGSDGGIFTFGDARFYGSTGGMRLAAPVVGIASAPNGHGYWLVASDGGIFSFGNAPFLGSMGGVALDQPVQAVVATVGGSGYMMIGADGGIFAFGATDFHGSLGGKGRSDIVGAAPLIDGSGYYMASSSGAVFGFGNATAAVVAAAPAPVDIEANIEQEIFARINGDRNLRGLPSLRWDAELATTARSWSDTMASSGFRHSNLGQVIGSVSTFHLSAGENIYWGTAHLANSATAHQSLMDSSGHREAILETAYTTGAVGVTCVGGQLWVTQHFGHPESDGPVQSSGSRSRLPQQNNSSLASTSC